ncbi:hypothetical protein [Salinigranum halophilum]|jgi:hypothetical protein|uniref:hypothetical protein n=1 Tax=Salinigranum halophilum TaxID=2565931 RepID=UPI0010A92A1F|nr:hypothetical protein [Salinigranum halophilum]
MDVPEDAPDVCPVCETAYDSVSRHDAGLMVNLLDNARYRRVCFEPVSEDGVALVRFYHHTHDQVGVTAGGPIDDATDAAVLSDPVSGDTPSDCR